MVHKVFQLRSKSIGVRYRGKFVNVSLPLIYGGSCTKRPCNKRRLCTVFSRRCYLQIARSLQWKARPASCLEGLSSLGRCMSRRVFRLGFGAQEVGPCGGAGCGVQDGRSMETSFQHGSKWENAMKLMEMNGILILERRFLLGQGWSTPGVLNDLFITWDWDFGGHGQLRNWPPMDQAGSAKPGAFYCSRHSWPRDMV